MSGFIPEAEVGPRPLLAAPKECSYTLADLGADAQRTLSVKATMSPKRKSGAPWPATTSASLATSAHGGRASDIDLLRYLDCIIDLDAEVTNGALDLRMPKQKLDRPQISGAAVD